MTIALSQPTFVSPLVSLTDPQRQANGSNPVSWSEYVALRDDASQDWRKIIFDAGWLWVDMGKEGPNHAAFSDLITAIFFVWSFIYPQTPLQSYGRCLIEQQDTSACAPDLVLYQGDNIPRWQVGEPRRIDLSQHRLPDLVGEISDTTLSLDLDEQKQLYAKLGIVEYWVIDVKGLRVFAFGLTEAGTYAPIETSQILSGLPIRLVEQTLERLPEETNTAAANWFRQQLANLGRRE
jgi:Uma2 family endonuclease